MRGERFNLSTNPSMPKIRQQPTPTYPAGGGRKKKDVSVKKSWLVLNSSGQSQTKYEGKHAVMKRTGLPTRDLRILDPLLSCPSTVLGRERAIVINLEHIKAIITAQEVLLLNYKDPSVVPFIEELQSRILSHHYATKPQEQHNSEEETNTRVDDPQGEAGMQQSSRDQGIEEALKKDAKQSLENQDGSSKVLPFEFVALEVCLEAVSSSLEHEAVRLELEVNSAMDKLTSKINTLNLERVRQIKSRLVAITRRVENVRNELEHLIDDDEDMAKMYLTKKSAEKLEDASNSSMNDRELPQGDEEDDRLPPEIASEANRDTNSTRRTKSKKLEVEELEMLLEAYFVLIDSTLNKLSIVKEYVDDTEDYINIMLDDKQNQLLQMGVMLTTANLVMSLFIAVAGVFGMNITIELIDKNNPQTVVEGPRRFLWTVVGGSLGSLFLYVGAIGWCKYKRLLV